MRLLLGAVMALSFSMATAVAGPKEDFVSAVKKQCGKDDAAAKALATGGRQGNVMKLKTCAADSITVGDCTLSCKDASSSIGG